MPEVYLTVKWPDNEVQEIYSPSTIIETYFQKGDKLEVEQFLSKITEALEKASQRVEAKYGYACTSAMASINKVQSKAKDVFEQNQPVEILDLQ